MSANERLTRIEEFAREDMRRNLTVMQYQPRDVLALVEIARAAQDACDYGDAKRIRALAAALARLEEA